MSRYIDADKFAKQAYEVAYPIVHDNNSHERGLTLMGIARLLDDQPTADVVEVVRCKDCIYYDPPHVEDHGERRDYIDMPREAFDKLGTGFVNSLYGVNVGGRCCRDYNAGYSEDKRVYVSESNYCGRAERADT